MTNSKDRVSIVAIVTLGVVIIVAIVGITLAAIFTKRDLTLVEGMVAGGVLLIALLGGLVIRYARNAEVRRNGNGHT
jgi:hypothetical protein